MRRPRRLPRRARRAGSSILAGLVAPRVAEPAPPPPPRAERRRGYGSLQLRHVDAGSCNGCEVEIANALGPVYDASRYGISLVASPRHADGLLVTGVVTANMAGPLGRTLEAVPAPAIVIACGDCALNGGVVAAGFGVVGPVAAVVAPTAEIPGCPPHPDAIIAALRRYSGR